MANIIINETKRKDWKDVNRDPEYGKAVRVGQERIKRGLHKVNPEIKEEYDKRVKGNPANIPGLPAFFPPLSIRSAMNDIKSARECKCGGCATYLDNYQCPRCGETVQEE